MVWRPQLAPLVALVWAACVPSGSPADLTDGSSTNSTRGAESSAGITLDPTTGAATAGSMTTANSTGSSTGGSTGDTDGAPACPPPPGRAYDLDGDGVTDTDLALVACAVDPNETCLRADSDLPGWPGGELDLDLGHPPDPMVRLAPLGDLMGGPMAEVSVKTGDETRVRLLVVDLESAQVLATSASFPEGFYGVFVTEAGRSDGTLVPLATGERIAGGTLDGVVCVFSPNLSQVPCGQGFGVWDGRPVYARPSVYSATRQNLAGGWVQDIDGDGEEDLAIPHYDIALDAPPSAFYGGYVGVASSGATLGMTALRFATKNPVYAALPATFDSGRIYGVHHAFPPEAGVTSVLAVGGLPVGSFTGDASIIMCNVTRYVARIDAPLGELNAGALRWGYYFGFYQGLFQGTYPNQSVLKEPDLLQGCLHRAADARAASAEGDRFVAYSLFQSDVPVDNCKVEQLAYVNGGSLDAYLACVAKNFATRGTWEVQWLDEATGAGVGGESGRYLWGFVERLVPEQQGTALLVEPIAGHPRFDRADHVSAPLVAQVASSAGGWHAATLGEFPVAGPPKVRVAAPARNIGVVSQPYVEIETRINCDAEGLVDVAMQDGTWVGWDTRASALVVKD